MNRILNSFFSPPGSAPSLEDDNGYLYAVIVGISHILRRFPELDLGHVV